MLLLLIIIPSLSSHCFSDCNRLTVEPTARFRALHHGRYKTQVTGHRSQVTENAIKKLDTLLGFLCSFICFISGYVTIRQMFGIDHASCCSKSKRTNWRKLHIVLELEELHLSFGCQETSKRCFVFAPPGGTWIEDGTEK